MHRILIAGLPDRLAGWLAQRLRGVTVEVAYTGDDALSVLGEGTWAALIIDQAVEGLPADRVIRYARGRPGAGSLPVILTLDAERDSGGEDRLRRLVGELRVDRVLLAPLDRGELARHVATLVHTEPIAAAEPAANRPGGAAPAGAAPDVNAALAAVWERALPTILGRIQTIESAITALLTVGSVPREVRESAEREAHRLAGALGTFGSHEGTRLARAIEAGFAVDAPTGRDVGGRLSTVVSSLRREVEARAAAAGFATPAVPSTPPPPAKEAPPAAPAPVPAPTAAGGPLLAVLGDDEELRRSIAAEASRRGLRTVEAALSGAAALLEREPADAILVDVGQADEEDAGGWAVLPEVARRGAGVPLLVSAGRDSLLDRVRLLQMGVRMFLEKPFAAAEAVGAVLHLLPRGEQAGETRVLAVDDDPQILAAVRALLEPQRLTVHTLDSPLRFWSTLRQVQPDLLILDVDMPHLDGIELCRVVRSDHRWSALPVLFLTARTDAETILRVFAAGADDYVTKPVVGPELIARLRNRLDRLAPRRNE
jgi:DNA-binding response OmpR family regulator/HPt (histidine-containing phosphotransfer) domain-containing protein